MSVVTDHKNINIRDSLNLWSLSTWYTTSFKVKLLSHPISSTSASQVGQLTVITHDNNEEPVYQWYFSNFGALGRKIWDSANQVWVNSEGAEGEADYYLLKSSQSANKVFASPNGSAGKPTFRSLVAADLPVVPYSKGGLGVAASNANEAAHAIYGAKTAGDSISLNSHSCAGYLTTSKTQAVIILTFPYKFYGVSTIKLTGTFTARQNNNYLFGSTATTPRNLSNHTVTTAIGSDGWIRVTITGSAQSAAINNHPISIYFNTLTVALS